MFDTTDQILRQLRAGEDSRVEFKELRFGERGVISPNTEDFASEMVAFANGVGGTLYLGVDDTGSEHAREMVSGFERVLVTPNTLTEASNLLAGTAWGAGKIPTAQDSRHPDWREP